MDARKRKRQLVQRPIVDGFQTENNLSSGFDWYMMTDGLKLVKSEGNITGEVGKCQRPIPDLHVCRLSLSSRAFKLVLRYISESKPDY